MLIAFTIALALQDRQAGREVYLSRCFWCHGESGRGDGPASGGMFPPPRDFVRADYKIRSTAHGRLPTDEDLYRAIARGLPDTPMPGWEKVLTKTEIQGLVEYLKSLSPRFREERREPIPIPSGPASAERGAEVYRKARCSLCHGDAGRGDGRITNTLAYEWGLPHRARNLTRGWTFKGGHEPREIYPRITGGLNGTPMGPYRDLLTDRERWDLAHYVASLDREPSATSERFLVTAALVGGDLPADPGDPTWGKAEAVTVPLAGQIVRDATPRGLPSTRWWMPTAGSCAVRAIHNGRDVALLLEWDDPTKEGGPFADSAFLQFPSRAGEKPYFLGGDPEHPVTRWDWREGESSPHVVSSGWNDGRRYAIFRRRIHETPAFAAGGFVPILFSIRDGSNGEYGERRALSTWLYVALEPPATALPWVAALAVALGTLLLEVWIVRRLAS